LLQYAQKIGGKEQIAIEQYADAIEILPKILVENSGEDPLDIITTLRSKTNMAKKQYFGYDALSGKIVDPVQTGIIEPLQVKLKVFSLATELAVTFIRIDDYIRASRPH
jgi:chaperonin GroEL (HSP60 family)